MQIKIRKRFCFRSSCAGSGGRGDRLMVSLLVFFPSTRTNFLIIPIPSHDTAEDSGSAQRIIYINFVGKEKKKRIPTERK